MHKTRGGGGSLHLAGYLACTWLVLMVLQGDCWSCLLWPGRGVGCHSLAAISVGGFILGISNSFPIVSL